MPEAKEITGDESSKSMKQLTKRSKSSRVQITFFLVLAAVSVVLAITYHLLPYSRPAATVGALVKALGRGDVGELIESSQLSMRQSMESEINLLGQGEFRRIAGLFDAQLRLGEAEYARIARRHGDILQQSIAAGELAFWQLSEEERWQVWVGSTREAWVFEQARRSLTVEQRARVPERSVYNNRASLEEWIVNLGCVSLGEDTHTVLQQVRDGELDASDPSVARIIARCDREGTSRFEPVNQVLVRLRSQIDPGDRRRPDSGRAPTALANEQQRMAELGQVSISEADRSFLEAHRGMLESPDRVAHQQALGWELLDESSRQELSQHERARFFREEPRFVRERGRQLMVEHLRGRFDNCRFALEQEDLTGSDRRGLLRTGQASLRGTWKGMGLNSARCASLGSVSLRLNYDDGHWFINDIHGLNLRR